MTLDWIVGFVEGEGCFTWLGKWNNTTRNGKRVYYSRRQPQFLVAQNGRQVLDLIAAFLTEYGITVRVWPKSKHGRGQDGRPDGSGAYELRVLGYGNCAVIVDLFTGRLQSDRKREQFTRWAEEVLASRTRRPVEDSELIRCAAEVYA